MARYSITRHQSWYHLVITTPQRIVRYRHATREGAEAQLARLTH